MLDNTKRTKTAEKKNPVQATQEPAPTGWVLNCNLQHNGVKYVKDLSCPADKLEELRELGFVEKK